MAAVPLLEETSGGPAGAMVSGLAGLARDADPAHIQILANNRPERKLAIYPASAGFDRANGRIPADTPLVQTPARNLPPLDERGDPKHYCPNVV